MIDVHGNLSNDDSFGPILETHKPILDFTLLFERTILSIAPSALFLVYVPLRAWVLCREERKARWGWGPAVKQIIYLLLLATQISMLVFYTTFDDGLSLQAAIPSQTLALAVVIGLSSMSLLEHIKSPRSSDLINVYLLFSIIFDAAQVRTQWLRQFPPRIAIASTLCLAMKLLLLFAEAQGKSRSLLDSCKELALETRSGVFARRLFWWLNGLLKKGYYILVKPVDLMDIKEEFSSRELLGKIEQASIQQECETKSSQSLWKACFITLKWDTLIPVIPRVAMIAIRYMQPFLFNSVIGYLQSTHSTRPVNHAYGLIAATGLLYLSLVISTTYYQHRTYQLVTKLRGCLVALLFSRTLESVPGSVEPGAPSTLMSVDVDGVTRMLPILNEIWASPVEIGIAVWLLKNQLGAVWAVPLGIALICTATSVYLSRKMGKRQTKWNEATQDRISSTSSMLNFIRSIKLMGFERRVIGDIQAMRDEEIRKSKAFRRFTVFLNLLGNIPYYLAPVLTFTVFVAVGGEDFTVDKAFTSLSLISLLEQSTVSFVSSMPTIAAALGCLERIEKFLHSTRATTSSGVSQEEPVRSPNAQPPSSAGDEKAQSIQDTLIPLFSVTNASYCTSSEPNRFTLRDITLSIFRKSFIGITGPSGCGKTTLIKGLLNRLPSESSFTSIGPDESIAYCSQDVWLPSGSIREVIIGESAWDEWWYNKILKACALDKDLEVIKGGDRKKIGSGGSTMSGGQRQRLTLARALYSRTRIVVLDDVLSGMDGKTTKYICQAIFGKGGLLRELEATVVVVAHSGYVLSFLDKVVSMTSEGRIESVRETLREVNEHACFSALDLPNDDPPDITPLDVGSLNEREEEVIDEGRQIGDWGLYKHYILSVGWLRFGLLLATDAASAALDNLPTIWLKEWSTAVSSASRNNNAFYIGIYFTISALGLLSVLFGIYIMFLSLVPLSGRNLHNTLLHTVVHAEQSFHDRNPIGTTLNRFAQDMQHIDRDLPAATIRALSATFACIATAVLLSLSASYVAAFIPVILLALYLLQKFYLRTSRQLRLLEIEARAPLYQIFQETAEGLDIISSFGWTSSWKSRMFKILDASQKPYYLLFCIQRWLILVLGFIVAAVAVVLVAFATQIQGLSSAGAIGIGLMAILDFNDRLNNLVIEWTTLETSLGAIARLKAFQSDTPMERAGDGEHVPEDWPREGNVVFSNVSVSYGEGHQQALKNISLEIPAGSTFAIIGRTGSGKSTAISALMGVVPLHSGAILIDNVLHTTIPLQSLRSRVVCLPQQMYLLSGTLRRNLDPERQCGDEALRAALLRVGLWETLTSYTSTSLASRSTDASSVLDQPVGCMSLSSGQVQLLALARLLVLETRPRIILLDEATSNMDEASEALVQGLIWDEFAAKGCTVIAVAHRLEMIRNFDYAAVLDGGEIVKVGRAEDVLDRMM